MRQITLLLCGILIALPFGAGAQDEPPLGELLEQFRNFGSEVLPLLDDFAKELGAHPGYHAPEILPNGDILIRRRKEAPKPGPEKDTPEAFTDL